jgi:hypothetical protein
MEGDFAIRAAAIGIVGGGNFQRKVGGVGDFEDLEDLMRIIPMKAANNLVGLAGRAGNDIAGVNNEVAARIGAELVGWCWRTRRTRHLNTQVDSILRGIRNLLGK